MEGKEGMEGNQGSCKTFKELDNISHAMGQLLLDIAQGRFQLEEASLDTGTYRTVLKVSVLPTDKLRKEIGHELRH